MVSKFEGSVPYFQFVDCTLDAARQNRVRGQATAVARLGYKCYFTSALTTKSLFAL